MAVASEQKSFDEKKFSKCRIGIGSPIGIGSGSGSEWDRVRTRYRVRVVLGWDRIGIGIGSDRIGIRLDRDRGADRDRIGMGSGSEYQESGTPKKINTEYLKNEQISQTQYWVCSKWLNTFGDKHKNTKYHWKMPQWRLPNKPSKEFFRTSKIQTSQSLKNQMQALIPIVSPYYNSAIMYKKITHNYWRLIVYGRINGEDKEY